MQKNAVIYRLCLEHGRRTKEDKIDYLAGIVLEKKIGDKVEKGEALAYVHTNKEEVIKIAIEELKIAYEIRNEKPEKYKHILEII